MALSLANDAVAGAAAIGGDECDIILVPTAKLDDSTVDLFVSVTPGHNYSGR